MAATLVRLALLTTGLAAVEIGLGGALPGGSPLAGGVLILAGLTLILAGSAGFIGPLLGARSVKGTSTDG